MRSKSDFDFNFRYIKSFNVENLKEKVMQFSNEWEINTSRQNVVYEDRPNPHLNTHTYIIQDSSLYWNRGEDFFKNTLDKESYDIVSTIVNDLEDRMVGISARILLIKLSANSKVFVHKDSGDYLSSVRRFHIPIITNPDVYYTVGGEKINMKSGECYEINNLRLHSVDNESDQDRVHLLIDIMPESEIKTIKSLKTDARVKEIKNFIEKEDADILVEYINNNHLDIDKFLLPATAAKNNRFRYESNVPEHHAFSNHKEIIGILKKYSDKFLHECKTYFNDPEDLYLASQWLTMLGAGTRLPDHYDNHVGAEHLFRSGVIYLNDEFDGGFLKFPELNLTVNPEKYSIVIFESHTLHQITEVISGIRMAMPIWATNKKERGISHG